MLLFLPAFGNLIQPQEKVLIPPDGEEAPALEIFVFHRTGYILLQICLSFITMKIHLHIPDYVSANIDRNYILLKDLRLDY